MTGPPASVRRRRAAGLEHPGRWLWLLLLLPVLLGFWRLRLDVDVLALLPADLPAVRGLRIYQERFANARELLITLRGASAEETEAAARGVADCLREHPGRVAGAVWQPPWLEHPGQAAELLAFAWLNQPPAVFEEWRAGRAPGRLRALLADAKEQLATSLSPGEIARRGYDPFGVSDLPPDSGAGALGFTDPGAGFSSPDGRFRVVYVQAAGELANYRQCDEWFGGVRATVEEYLRALPSGSRPRVAYTGRPAFVAEVAKGMERDLRVSVGGTALIIAVLFWLAHRRVKPMLWLLALLALVLAATLGLGGLIFGAINVVSLGFAAILLGLAVDYAVVHYQEALAQPELSVPQVRRAIAPSIFWAALTTIAAFLMLNFGGLPGLAQLGTLVALGVALAALIMVFEFLPPLFPGRVTDAGAAAAEPSGREPELRPGRRAGAPALAATLALAAAASLVLCAGWPELDSSSNALRPRSSAAYDTLAEVQSELARDRDPLWLVIEGTNETEVARALAAAQPLLERAMAAGTLSGFYLPRGLWPVPEHQRENRAAAAQLAARAGEFAAAARAEGFSDESLGLLRGVLEVWRTAGLREGVFWPENELSRWVLDRFAARAGAPAALGLLNAPATVSVAALRKLQAELPARVTLSGWSLLGGEVLARVRENFGKLVAPMILLVLGSLALAFRNPAEVLLSLAVLGLSGVCLLALMRLAGWSWNLLNLMAIPILLGTGVDYGIFMQLALRRHGGDRRLAWRSVGRALLLCGGTAIAGFGSLAWAGNGGLAGLGRVCAAGIAANMLIAVFLLPWWWQWLDRAGWTSRPAPAAPAKPSFLYQPRLWRLGLGLARHLPSRLCHALGWLASTAYWAAAPHRRRVVVENLLPAVADDPRAARRAARRLYRQFGRKLVDLWQHEAGLPASGMMGESIGWEHFVEAQRQNRGLLLLAPHLGNWEFGGRWLAAQGVGLQVVTLAEPGGQLTALRRESRARWNIETVVIGNDPLAFVEIIRKLEAGAAVALLMDRPPHPSAVTVQLFGRPFRASVAAAELARASGCALLPGFVLRERDRYRACLLPPIPYDRAALRDREARRRLTQAIMTVFEPVIREHLDQWYHFVPLWNGETARRTPPPANPAQPQGVIAP